MASVGKYSSPGRTWYPILDRLPKQDHLVRWFNFTEGGGSTLYDRTGSGNNATVYNGSWTSLESAGLSYGLKKDGYILHGTSTTGMYFTYYQSRLYRPWTLIMGIRPQMLTRNIFLFWKPNPNRHVMYMPANQKKVIGWDGSHSPNIYCWEGSHGGLEGKLPVLCGFVADSTNGKIIVNGLLFDYGASFGEDLNAGTVKIGYDGDNGLAEGGIFFFAIWNCALSSREVAEVAYFAGMSK